MREVKTLLDLLDAPGNLLLEGNAASRRLLARRASELVRAEREEDIGKVATWHLPEESPAAGPRIRVLPTGHAVFYGNEGRRILCADPDGTPLHECEWARAESGAITMTRARIQLDCRQWVGVRPEAIRHTTTLDLPAQPGCPEPTPDELRRMAAKAWQVPLDDVRYFYPDDGFTRDREGRVTIRLKKDGLYLLEDGTFRRARFVSYMGAIPWARIDLLNVVELYQSTLPGTGGAAFDLIWGLCWDQRLEEGAICLRYRGLPTFPSEQAYGLFCAYFRPEAPEGEDPFKLFMDHQRGYQIAWWPRPDPPWRYFDRTRRLCVTVQGGVVQKVTVIDDPVAVPYVNLRMRGFASCGRSVSVAREMLQLREGGRTTELPIPPTWGVTKETPPGERPPTYPFGWRELFGGMPPSIEPARAWATALFFPDDDSMVGEESTQLFVLEQIYGYFNSLPDPPSRLRKVHRMLIHNFDPVCAGFVDPDYAQRRYTVLYNRPEWALKNAQAIWDRAAREGRLEAVRNVNFLPERELRAWTFGGKYELIYEWIPFADYGAPPACETVVKEVAGALAPRGLAFVVGPPCVAAQLEARGVRVLRRGGPEDLRGLPAMVEHFRIHPKTRVNPELTVVMGEKGD
jgi:hypothetical protein